MVAGASQEIQDALAAYGEEVGLVFQLSDDIIDITSDVTGKTPGTDLREGVPTLPTLLLADSQDPADQPLKDLLAGDLSDDAALVEAADCAAFPPGHRAVAGPSAPPCQSRQAAPGPAARRRGEAAAAPGL